jgi:hypothetical protein
MIAPRGEPTIGTDSDVSASQAIVTQAITPALPRRNENVVGMPVTPFLTGCVDAFMRLFDRCRACQRMRHVS